VLNKAKYFVKVNIAFNKLRLEDEIEDPKVYIRELEEINECYKRYTMKYIKDGMEVMTPYMFSASKWVCNTNYDKIRVVN
jgi:hypothetical protein